MSTSEYGGIIEYDPSDLAANEPVDTALVRRVINNANHHADQAGQVVCNWVAVNPALGGEPMRLAYPDSEIESLFGGAGALDAESWIRFGLTPTWDARVRSDGSGYRLRVRISGGMDPYNPGFPVDYAIVVGPAGMSEADVGASHRVTRYVTGVTNPARHALVLDGAAWIDVPGDVIGAARDAGAHQATIADIGGPGTTVTTARMEVMVCGRGVAVDSLNGRIINAPVVHSLYIAEYIGP